MNTRALTFGIKEEDKVKFLKTTRVPEDFDTDKFIKATKIFLEIYFKNQILIFSSDT